MAEFPNTFNQDWTADDFRLAKELIDYAVDLHNQNSERTKLLNDLYNGYNGILNESMTKKIVNRFGGESQIPYVDFKLGRTKISLLRGEYEETVGTQEVMSVNIEAKTKKMNKYLKRLGLSLLKPDLEVLRKQGFNVLPNTNIEEYDPQKFEKNLDIKLEHEKLAQDILDIKQVTEKLSHKFSKQFLNILIASEAHGKIIRNEYGSDTIRVIPNKNMIFLELEDDDFAERSPVKGEVRYMTKSEVIKEFEITDKEEMNELSGYYQDPASKFGKNFYQIGSQYAIPVYSVEWKAQQVIVTKITPAKDSLIPYRNEVSYKNYQKESFKEGLKAGKYSVDVRYPEILWEGHRIGTSLYKKIRPVVDPIISSKGGIYEIPEYSYRSVLAETIDGYRVSVFMMLVNISETYNYVRWLINRELSRIKSSTIVYDRAYLPTIKSGNNKKASSVNVLQELLEEGIMEFDSSKDDIPEGKTIKDAIITFQASDTSLLERLVLIGQDLERLSDRISGINDNRQGVSKASQTATSAMQDLSASKSITNSLFNIMKTYEEDQLTSLIQRTIKNTDWLQNYNNINIGDDQKMVGEILNEMGLHSFVVRISNGQKERDVKERIRSLYEIQLTNKEIASHMIAKAELTETFNEYLSVLEEGWTLIKEQEAVMAQQANESNERMNEANIKAKEAEREDKQAHEIEKLHVAGSYQLQIADLNKKYDYANERQKAQEQQTLETINQ